jgi:spore maturation protein SpmA
MAHINDCIPGTAVKLLRSGVVRVVGKSGVIVEVSRTRRPATGPLKDQVTVDVPGHGEIVVAPADLEVERPA